MIDLCLAATIIVVLFPLLATIAALIALFDGRPVLFRQERVGHRGAAFVMLKFRTMPVGAELQLERLAAANERSGPLFKIAEDPRATRLGRALRRTSLDELPQLFNVVTGTMSLVGPRPALFSERTQFPSELRRREDVPPGITGRWQVEARATADFASYQELDLAYVDEWSLGLDARILARTPLVVLRHARREGRERLADTGHVIDLVNAPLLASSFGEGTRVPDELQDAG